MKKSFFTFLLLMLLAASATAQNTQYWVNGIHYEVTGENTVKVIAANSDSYSGVITIPKTVNVMVRYVNSLIIGENYQRPCIVTQVGEGAFRDCTGLTDIILPNTITSIGKNAFYGCSSLRNVTMSQGVTEIGASAFAYCTSLTDITLPNSVTSMDWNVFYGCSALTSVTLSKNLTSLDGTFNGCSSLTSVAIPTGVVRLDGTFAGCSALSALTLPPSLRYIGANTFDGCSALTGIYLPNSVEYIGERAFAATGLTSMELPVAVSYLGESAFNGSTALTSISVRPANPPLMANSNVFSFDTYAQASLLVPETSLSSYKSADWWRVFMNIVADAALNNAYDFESDGICYLVTGPNTVAVTYRDLNYNSYSGTVTIPATVTHNGVTYSVTGIGNSAFRGCTGLTAVSMPSSVTTINKLAFYRSGLTSLELPEAVTYIGDSAFNSCSKLNNLASLTIPRNVSYIGLNAFYGVKMQALTWNAVECWSNGGMTTYDVNQVTIGSDVTVLPDNFVRNSNITSLELPESLTSIGKQAFYNADLTSVTIPENVTYIGSRAFDDAFSYSGNTTLTWNARECWFLGNPRYDDSWYWYYYPNNFDNFSVDNVIIGDEVEVLPCGFVARSSISQVNIPQSVKFIGDEAFSGCSNLTTVVIPDAVESIGDNAFAGAGVKDLTVGKGVTFVGCCAFDLNLNTLNWNARHCETMGYFHYYGKVFSLGEVTFGDEVEKIPNYFGYDTHISSVDLPPSVKEIGSHAFANCMDLSDIAIPGSVTKIDDYAFSNCSQFTDVYIPSSVKSIGSYAFSNCVKLKEVTVQAKSVGDGAFSNCSALNDLRLEPTLESIEGAAFSNCNHLMSLHFPATLKSLDGHAFVDCPINSIEVDAANPVYDSRNGCNAVMRTADNAVVMTCSNSQIPEDITAIGDYAFYDRSDLTSFTVPSTVTSIGNYAFGNCNNLASIEIPSSVTSMGEGVFSYCSSLSSVTLPEGITRISNRMFESCSKLRTVSIPAAVTSIGYGAFMNCPISSIVIPEGVTSIGTHAFSGTSLRNITCLPTTPPEIDCETHHYVYDDGSEYDYIVEPSYTFDYYIYNNGTLYVPQASIEAYQAATCWSGFKNVQAIEALVMADVDGNGVVDMDDLTVLINQLMDGELRDTVADVNGDGVQNMDDLTALINMLLNGQ